MPFLALTLEVKASEAQSVSDWLMSSGAFSLSFESAGEDDVVEPNVGRAPLWRKSRVSALFPTDADFCEICQNLGAAPKIDSVEFLKDEDWVTKWNRENRRRRRYGSIWVVPKDSDEAAGKSVVKLDPGLAFGAGDHPTTALCLRWLGSQHLSDRSVLDFGCGSGILAMVVALRGARPVTAIDHDPQALQATRENAEVNGVTLEVLNAIDPEQSFDVVVANILASSLIKESAVLPAVSNPQGLIALSGILKHQASSVISAFHKFAFDPPYCDGEWVLLVGRKTTQAMA